MMVKVKGLSFIIQYYYQWFSACSLEFILDLFYLQVYSKVSGDPPLENATVDVSSKEFYGEGYDDSDKRIPDMTIINRQLGWNPKTSLWDLLESTLTYQHRTYAEAIKKVIAKPVAS